MSTLFHGLSSFHAGPSLPATPWLLTGHPACRKRDRRPTTAGDTSQPPPCKLSWNVSSSYALSLKKPSSTKQAASGEGIELNLCHLITSVQQLGQLAFQNFPRLFPSERQCHIF